MTPANFIIYVIKTASTEYRYLNRFSPLIFIGSVSRRYCFVYYHFRQVRLCAVSLVLIFVYVAIGVIYPFQRISFVPDHISYFGNAAHLIYRLSFIISGTDRLTRQRTFSFELLRVATVIRLLYSYTLHQSISSFTMSSSKSTTGPPSSLFTAVLFQSSLQNSNNNNDDVEVEPNCLSMLQEPLLTESSTDTVTKESGFDTTTTSSSPLQDAAWLLRLKVLNFSTGSLSALLSQYILSQTMWNETVLSSPFGSVLIFSLLWSFWTCVIVFSSMFCNVWILGYRHNNNKNTATKTPSANEWDRLVFQMEAHHVVGALLAISLTWIFIDVLRIAVHARAMYSGIFVLMTAVCYGIFFKVMVSSNPAESVMMPTYQLLATTLGLIVGLCSQFVLSFALWRDHMTSPIFSNVILFSLVWSVLTVSITFLGCVTLRSLTIDENENGGDGDENTTGSKESALEKERIHLRMESHYVFAALIGICGAWILMDLVLDMPQQILPSLGMLVVALAAFSGIIYCFPEAQCLEEYSENMEQEGQQQTYTSVAVVDTV
jgi:hypothetical protein